MCRAWLGLACAVVLTASSAAAQAPSGGIPLGTGATIVQTLSTPNADRESIHRVRLASESGLHYEWGLEEVDHNGDTLKAEFRYLEAWNDIASAKRLRGYHEVKDPEAHPGYTMHAISRAVYRRMLEGKADSFQIMYLNEQPAAAQLRSIGISLRAAPVRWRGTIAPAGKGMVPFPVLLNGHRVQLRAIHLKLDLRTRLGRWQPEFWVNADSAYPLILKWVGAFGEPGNVLQTTRIDLPYAGTRTSGATLGEGALLVGRDGLGELALQGGDRDGRTREAAALELQLSSACRVELPGIYFAFNSAHIAPASERAIAQLAGILQRHPDWTGLLEGHTDSIGSAAANKALSRRRVEAVRTQLVERHGIDPARLRVEGLGEDQPIEPNRTIEGRARNRRVELVRDCGKDTGR